MTERDAASCLLTIATWLFIVAVAVLVGHFFGVAIGFVTFLVIMAAYLVACVVAYYKNEGECE